MRSVVRLVSLTGGALLLAAAIALPSAAQNQQLPRPGQLPPPGGGGQQQQQRAPQAQPQQQPPPQRSQPAPQQSGPLTAPAKPYKTVTISAPPPVNDQSFAQFRQQLGDIAKRKDRAALARMIVSKDFFWEGERGDRAEAGKPAIDNFASAIGLPDAGGWEYLTSLSMDPTGNPLQGRDGVICAPADPMFDEQQFEDLVKATNTEEADWGFTMRPGIEMRSSAQPNSAVVEKLGMHFVRVMPDETPPNEQNPMLRIVAPSGKTGYIRAEALSPLGNDQICYTKEGSGWKIAGFIGGAQ